MSGTADKKFYLVAEDILPAAVRKTIHAKEIIADGDFETINEVVARFKLSRSAYYKYKDSVMPFYDAADQKLVTVALTVERDAKILADVFNVVAESGGRISTFSQNFPAGETMQLLLSVELGHLKISAKDFFRKLEGAKGVRKFEFVGRTQNFSEGDAQNGH